MATASDAADKLRYRAIVKSPQTTALEDSNWPSASRVVQACLRTQDLLPNENDTFRPVQFPQPFTLPSSKIKKKNRIVVEVDFTFSVAGLDVVGSALIVDKQLDDASNDDVTDMTPT